jgi:hypothetical protein
VEWYPVSSDQADDRLTRRFGGGSPPQRQLRRRPPSPRLVSGMQPAGGSWRQSSLADAWPPQGRPDRAPCLSGSRCARRGPLRWRMQSSSSRSGPDLHLLASRAGLALADAQSPALRSVALGPPRRQGLGTITDGPRVRLPIMLNMTLVTCLRFQAGICCLPLSGGATKECAYVNSQPWKLA